MNSSIVAGTLRVPQPGNDQSGNDQPIADGTRSVPATLVPDGGPGFRLYRFLQDNVCTYVPLDKHGLKLTAELCITRTPARRWLI